MVSVSSCRKDGRKMSNEKRLIDANALKKQFVDYVRTPPHFHYGDWPNMCINGTEIDEVIANAPTVDAVEVVRCQYCGHHSSNGFPDNRVWCRRLSRYMDNDGFCSYGERKDDES